MPDLPYDIGHRPTNLPDLARTLRAAAQGRREYADSHPRCEAWDRVVELLRMQADTLDQAARIAEGDLGPLYNWLPSWRWTPEMTAVLRDDGLASEETP